MEIILLLAIAHFRRTSLRVLCYALCNVGPIFRERLQQYVGIFGIWELSILSFADPVLNTQFYYGISCNPICLGDRWCIRRFFFVFVRPLSIDTTRRNPRTSAQGQKSAQRQFGRSLSAYACIAEVPQFGVVWQTPGGGGNVSPATSLAGACIAEVPQISGVI